MQVFNAFSFTRGGARLLLLGQAVHVLGGDVRAWAAL